MTGTADENTISNDGPDAFRLVSRDFDEYETLLPDEFSNDTEDIALAKRNSNNGWDRRIINHAVAHWANIILKEMFEFEGNVTTTQHNERVILSWDNWRNPTEIGSYCIPFSEEFHPAYTELPSDEDEYVERFADTVRGLVFRAVDDISERLDRVEMA